MLGVVASVCMQSYAPQNNNAITAHVRSYQWKSIYILLSLLLRLAPPNVNTFLDAFLKFQCTMPQARCIIATLALASPSNINVLTRSVLVLEIKHSSSVSLVAHSDYR